MTFRIWISEHEQLDPLPAQATATSTVRECLERLVIPDLVQAKRSPETIADYRRHVRAWETFCVECPAVIAPPGDSPMAMQLGGSAAPKYRMVHPVLADVRRRHLLEFQRWLLSKGHSNRTANKHLQDVTMVLRAAAKSEIIAAAPECDLLPEKAAADKLYLTREQVGLVYEGCSLATWPPADPPRRLWPAPDYWRGLTVMFSTYGPRTQEIVRYESRMETLTWGQISWSEETPSQAGTATCPHGWFWYTPQKQRWAKSDPLVLPLTEIAAAHLRAIMPPDPSPAAPVFDFPLSSDRLYEQWEAIRAAAKIRPKKNIKTGVQPEFQLKHFRKTATTLLNLHRPGIAEFIVGHGERDGASSKVSRDHYDNQELRIVEALLTFPQPPAFEAIYRARQRVLFD